MWNPAQYLRFSQARLRPALDLLARVPSEEPHEVCDLGCGTGSATRLLHARWPQAAIVGIDSSASMLATAALEMPAITWVEADLASWTPAGRPDVIYSNAALHWLPHHEQLLPRLLGALTPDGVLAVQMPRNFAAPSHALIAETVRAGPWRDRLEPLLGPPPVAAPEVYHQILAPLAQSLDIWETEYLHALTGDDPVKEWTKGSWLAQFLDRLGASERADFELDYALRLRLAYPKNAAGVTLFPFRRLFIVAVSPSG